MATGSKAATNWKAQSASYLPRTLKRLILQQIDFVLRSKDLVMYSELGYFLITMGAKIVKFMTSFLYETTFSNDKPTFIFILCYYARSPLFHNGFSSIQNSSICNRLA